MEEEGKTKIKKRKKRNENSDGDSEYEKIIADLRAQVTRLEKMVKDYQEILDDQQKFSEDLNGERDNESTHSMASHIDCEVLIDELTTPSQADENRNSTTSASERVNQDKASTLGPKLKTSQIRPEIKEKKGKASPPVFKIYNQNVKNLSNRLRQLLGSDLFLVSIVNKNLVNVKVNSNSDHQKVRLFLEHEGISFYTYTIKENKPYSVVIEGLSASYEADDLRDYLLGLNIPLNILKIVKLRGDQWLLNISNDSDLRSLYSVGYILHCRVKIRRYKQRGLIQCRNCQRFGHISTNCRLQYRCVKCSQSHEPGKCEIPPKENNNEEIIRTDPITGRIVKTIGLAVKCANCKCEGHVASSRDCPKRADLLRKLEGRKEARRLRTNVFPAGSGAVDGRQYSQVIRDNTIRNNGASGRELGIEQAAENAFRTIDADCRKLLGKDFVTCLTKVGEFATQYGRLSDETEKSKALFKLLLSIRLDG